MLVGCKYNHFLIQFIYILMNKSFLLLALCLSFTKETDAQKELLTTNKESVKDAKETFRETITDEQKEQLQALRAARSESKEARKEAKKIRRRVKNQADETVTTGE